MLLQQLTLCCCLPPEGCITGATGLFSQCQPPPDLEPLWLRTMAPRQHAAQPQPDPGILSPVNPINDGTSLQILLPTAWSQTLMT